MQPFVREVRAKFPHHHHMSRYPRTKQQVCKIQHCAAVERLHYATHDQFKVDAQAFDLVRESQGTSTSQWSTRTGSLAGIRGANHARQQW